MTASEPTSQELELRLEELHEASYGWALRCCGWNEADAEDVLQSAYVKVISGRAEYRGTSAFRTWLFGVIRLTAMEHHRRRRGHEKRAELLEREAVADDTAVVHPGDPAARAERSETLRRALAELPERQRDVLHLVFYQDLTVREAAEVMEVSLGTARVHYDRGKKRLRQLLAEPMEGGGDR